MVYLAGSSQVINSQNITNLKYDKSGSVKYIKFEGTNKIGVWNRPTSPDDFFSNILGVKEQDKFILKNKIMHKDGSYYQIYRQVYNGVSVEGGIYILHFKDGKMVKANGHFVNITDLNTSPVLTPEKACKYYAEYLQVPDTISLDFLHGLVIAEIENVSGSDTVYISKLCYKIDLLNEKADNGETGYIDAEIGKVLKAVKRGTDYSATGTFYTLYSDTKTSGTQYYNNTYNLCDSSRDAAIHTWDINNTYYTYYSSSRQEFTDNNTSWTEAEHSANNDQMALDIHWALQEIYDYFFDNHEEFEGFDGNNHDIDAYVHAIFDNSNKDNATYIVFANNYEAFFFGDGQSIFLPLGALDVVSHEYGHALTYNFTGLQYDDSVQSAINEGLSDIWGAVIENNISPEKDCWKIGEEVINVTGDDCLRNIECPESSTANIKMADTYGDDDYSSGGYYAKSGIMSHWFYLLTEGGTGTNDNDDNYVVYSLGIDDAAKIVFRGQTGEFASVTSFAEARTAMTDAADFVFGENSIQSLQVGNAWYAVGVGDDPGQVTISGPSLVCSSGAEFTLNNLPSVDSIIWLPGSNLNISSGQGTSSCTFYANGNGSSWIQARLVNECGSITLPRHDVWAGLPTGPTISPSSPIYKPVNNTFIVSITESPGASSSTGFWETYGCVTLNGGNSGSSASFYSSSTDGTGTIYVSTSNACGGNYYKTPVTVITGSGGDCGELPERVELPSFVISPNPAASYIDLEIGLMSDNPDFKARVEIYDSNSRIVKRLTTGSRTTRVNVADLIPGSYIVIVETDQVRLNGKFMVLK